MKRILQSCGAAAIALLVGTGDVAHAGTVNASVTGSPVNVTVGGEATVRLDFTLWGSNNPNGVPAVSYCATVTLAANGTFTCTSDALLLNAGQNYTVRGNPTAMSRDIRVVVLAGAECPATATYSMRLATSPGSGLNFGNDVQEIWRDVTINVSCPAPTAVVGCGHGYWKNHLAEWPAGYADRTVAELFNLPEAYSDIAGDVLMTVLNYPTGGSNTVVGKGKLLLVQAVAAYLNAVKFGASYFYTLPSIQQEVNNALAGGNKDQIEELKDLFDEANNHCELP